MTDTHEPLNPQDERSDTDAGGDILALLLIAALLILLTRL